jgi:tRNA pseudouridine55 synthase
VNNQFLNKVILFDKDCGITSSGAVGFIKKITGIKKIGHSGTLDKFASGLLVVCTGSATKLTRFFLESDKEYEAVIVLGKTTDTLDSQGEIAETAQFEHITENDVIECLKSFTGKQLQEPPIYSALKLNGKRYSDLTRSGVEVLPQKRSIEIYDITASEIDLKQGLLKIKVSCSKGTYIRSLARDIGIKLKTVAFLIELRRTKSGSFSIDASVNADNLQAAKDKLNDKFGKVNFLIEPIDSLDSLGSIIVKDELVKGILNGAYFSREDVVNIEEIDPKNQKKGQKTVKIISKGKKLLAIADIEIEKWYINYYNVFNS